MEQPSLESSQSKLDMGSNIEFCLVCGDRASGRHYGAISCEGCKGFFKRSIRKQLGYQCRGTMNCEVTKHHRNRCQHCRLQKCIKCGMRSDSVQHERKPIIDRKQDQNKSSTSENDQENTLSKPRKKESANDSVNYLSLFQLNPLLLQAATGVNSAQNFHQSLGVSSSSVDATHPTCIKLEEPIFIDEATEKMNNPESDMIESFIEQNLISDTFKLISMIESSLQGCYENSNKSEKNNLQSFLSNLSSTSTIPQFKIQIPNLLPKMHFVCEVASRVLFKSIDWLRDIDVWQYFDSEMQSEVLKQNWTDLLIVGLAQIIGSSQSAHLKSMIISTLVNYVKSLIVYNANDSNQTSGGSIKEAKFISGQKLRKLLRNIMSINKFIDSIGALELGEVEFAHMRVLCIFNPNKIYSNSMDLKCYHQKIASNLQNYLKLYEKSHDSINERIVSIFQAFSILPSLDGKIIEKLFFNILVDFIKIDNVLPYIINLGAQSTTGEYVQEMKHEKELDLWD